jgi:2-dehydropantoate 2-reductase
VLFTCKAYDLDSAMDAIAPAVDAKTAIVPMLNWARPPGAARRGASEPLA